MHLIYSRTFWRKSRVLEERTMFFFCVADSRSSCGLYISVAWGLCPINRTYTCEACDKVPLFIITHLSGQTQKQSILSISVTCSDLGWALFLICFWFFSSFFCINFTPTCLIWNYHYIRHVRSPETRKNWATTTQTQSQPFNLANYYSIIDYWLWNLLLVAVLVLASWTRVSF